MVSVLTAGSTCITVADWRLRMNREVTLSLSASAFDSVTNLDEFLAP